MIQSIKQKDMLEMLIAENVLLKKYNTMNESDFATKWSHWFLENTHMFNSSALEHKVTKGNTYNLNNWKKKQGHQLIALKNSTESTGVYHKISDQSSGTKPMDAFFLKNADSYLIVWFEKQKRFFNIPYDYLITKIGQTSISFCELDRDLIAYELLKKKKKKILEF